MWDELADHDVVGRRVDQIGRGDEDHLQLIGERRHRLHRGGEEPPANLPVDRSQRDQDVLPVRVEPVPREVGCTDPGTDRRAHEYIVAGKFAHRSDQRRRRKRQHKMVRKPQIDRVGYGKAALKVG